MIPIYIPTRGRPERQVTAQLLSKAAIPHTLVCTKRDPTLKHYLASYKDVMVVDVQRIADKRQAILEHANGKFVMLDDDLRFYKRISQEKFVIIDKPTDLKKMFAAIEAMLDNYAQVGLSDKYMCQTKPRHFMIGGRYNQVLAYNKKLFPKKPVPTFRTVTNEEHDMHLQLSASGRPVCILTEWSKDAPYYSKGGCSLWRTAEVEMDGFRQLESYWPELVKIVPHPKNISGFGVRFNWKKVDG